MYIYVYICISKLHASKVGNWSVFVSVSFSIVFLNVIFTFSYGRVPSMGLTGSRSYSCRLGSSYPNKVVKDFTRN